MKKIYIAGPYSGNDIITILGNVRQGINQAAHLIQSGHAVFCPFLDFLLAFTPAGERLSKEQYQANSLAWVSSCDVMLMLPGWEDSGGAKRERALAEELGLDIWE